MASIWNELMQLKALWAADTQPTLSAITCCYVVISCSEQKHTEHAVDTCSTGLLTTRLELYMVAEQRRYQNVSFLIKNRYLQFYILWKCWVQQSERLGAWSWWWAITCIYAFGYCIKFCEMHPISLAQFLWILHQILPYASYLFLFVYFPERQFSSLIVQCWPIC